MMTRVAQTLQGPWSAEFWCRSLGVGRSPLLGLRREARLGASRRWGHRLGKKPITGFLQRMEAYQNPTKTFMTYQWNLTHPERFPTASFALWRMDNSISYVPQSFRYQNPKSSQMDVEKIQYDVSFCIFFVPGFDACIKGGVKLFDTAEIYGPGRSEARSRAAEKPWYGARLKRVCRKKLFNKFFHQIVVFHGLHWKCLARMWY